MQYSADALTKAARPVVLTIGRASQRFGLRTLSRVWVRRFRTWTVRPISTPQMLALQAAWAESKLAYVVELAVILRSVLPWRWYYRLTGDPVALILELGRVAPSLQEKVLHRLVTVPGARESEAKRVDDPIARLRAEQRRAVYGDKATDSERGSLAVAALTVRAAYGDVWYWNPERWKTADGYVPFAVCILEQVGLQTLDARRRLEVADGYALANARDPRRVRSQLERIAYPTDVVS